MKLPKNLRIKETLKLFLDKYNYKISFICPAAAMFRSKNYEYALTKLNEVEPAHFSDPWSKIKSAPDLKYCYAVLDALKSFDDSLYEIRIESPIVNVYTNDTKYIETLAKIADKDVKFVSMPNGNVQTISKGKVIVKKLDFDFKVFLGTIKKRDYSNFVSWAQNSKKIRLTKKVVKDLSKDYSWGGGYFYVKDEQTLTMVKMFLTTDISRIEIVIKA
jgi:hypothetical protein